MLGVELEARRELLDDEQDLTHVLAGVLHRVVERRRPIDVVSLEMELYEGVRDEILEVRDGERTSRTFRLAPYFGTLEVASSPSGATAKVDGRERGATPLELKLPPGAYKVAIEKSGVHGRSYEVTVARGRGVVIGADQAVLEPIVGLREAFTLPHPKGGSEQADAPGIGLGGSALSAGNSINCRCFVTPVVEG